ncbi:hypothetical protein BKA70DRAFT_1031824, partial [Coprinopsis sp. MPI-PUGE-AT-0042]
VQLKASLAFYHKKDSLLYTGTGSGKTLVIAIAALLPMPSDNRIVIVISPLQRLQTTQAEDIQRKYQIPTIAINEHTPRTQEFFQV